jgi:hypothetical protein
MPQTPKELAIMQMEERIVRGVIDTPFGDRQNAVYDNSINPTKLAEVLVNMNERLPKTNENLWNASQEVGYKNGYEAALREVEEEYNNGNVINRHVLSSLRDKQR